MTSNRQGFSIYKDEELMLFIREGKVHAFDELYNRYSARMMTYFVRMLNFNRTLAEDALQDLFMKIVERPASFDSERPFKTWIYSVASNTCKNFYRHKEVVKKSELRMNSEETSFNDSFYNLASRLDAVKFRAMLDEVLCELSHEKKEAFLLRYQEDKSLAEIAQIQECPEGSVKSRLHYTLKILSEKLIQFSPVK